MDRTENSAREEERFEGVARAVAREAGELLRQRFREESPLQVTAKGLHDFVTEVDHQADAIIASALNSRFPDHVIMSEEGSPDTAAGGYRWIVDPLDATTNFIHGVPFFAVSIALESTDGLLACAIYDPFHDEMFHAARGCGARLNGEPITCSRTAKLGDALLATGFPFRTLSRLDVYLETLTRFIQSCKGLRRAGSAALDLAYTACGRYDGFWEVGLKPWDVAAGALLVREAGGRVTDVTGGDRFMGGDLVAAAPAIHAQMLGITRETLG